MRIINYLLIAFTSLSTISLAQDDKSILKIDSLKKELEILKDVGRLPILNELFESYKNSDYTKAIVYANEYYEISRNIGDSTRMVEGGRMQAYSLMDFGKNVQALQVLMNVLGIAERNQHHNPAIKKHIKYLLNNAGLAYTFLGNYDRALECQFRSLLIREEEGDENGVRKAYNNIGLIFYNLGDYKASIEYYQRAINLRITDSAELTTIYTNLSLCFNETSDYKAALYHLKLALTTCGKNCSNRQNMEVFQALGVAYRKMNVDDSAQKYMIKSLEIAKKTVNLRYQAECYADLGRLELNRGRNQLALRNFNDGLMIFKEVDFPKARVVIYEKMSQLYAKESDFRQAAFYATRYAELKDSVHSSKMVQNLTAIRTNFAGRDYIKRIKEREQLLQLKDEVIERQKSQVIFISVSGILFLLLALLLYRNYRSKQLANYRLEEKVRERTTELRAVNFQLQEQSKLAELNLNHLVHEAQSITSQLKGLCNLATHDLGDERARHYFGKVEGGASQLISLFSNLNKGQTGSLP